VPVVLVTDYGARGDGSADDTTAIAAALRDTAGTDLAVYLPEGVYNAGVLRVPEHARLIGDGASRTWLRGTLEFGGHSRMSDLKVGRAGRAFTFADGATDSLLERVTLVGGGGIDSGEQHGVIRFETGRSASFITFRDCEIGANSVDGNGVCIVDNGWSGATYHDILWKRCHFLGSPRMTFECIQRSDGVHPLTTGYSAIDLVDCTFAPSGSETVSYDGKYAAGHSRIVGCTFEGAGWNDAYPWGQGIEFNRAREMRFIGNTVYRCRGAMINHSGDPGTQAGTVFRDNVFDATVSRIDNVPTRATQVIYFNGVDGARFIGNLVKSDVGGELMYVSHSSGNQFADDRFVDTRAADAAFPCAWLTDQSSDNQFAGCLFQSAAPAGSIVLQHGSTGTSVRTSTFVTHGAPPVTTDESSAVALDGNIVQ